MVQATALSLPKTGFGRIDDGAQKGSDAQHVSEPLDVEQGGGHFPARMGGSNASGAI